MNHQKNAHCNLARWWIVEVKGSYLGKCYETEAAIRQALGPYLTINGNCINVWGPQVRQQVARGNT